MSMISSKIDALRMFKKNKRDVKIKEVMLFTEETVGSLMKLMAILEIGNQTTDKINNTIESTSKEVMGLEIKDNQTIESMPINLVFKRTTKKVLKNSNQLKTVSNKILNNLCNRNSNLCLTNKPQCKRKQLVKLITFRNILRLYKRMRKQTKQ